MAHLTIDNLAAMSVQKVNAGDSLETAISKVFSESTVSKKLGKRQNVYKQVRARAIEILEGNDKAPSSPDESHLKDAQKHETYHKKRLGKDF